MPDLDFSDEEPGIDLTRRKGSQRRGPQCQIL